MRQIQTHGAQFLLALVLSLTLWTYVSFTTNPTATRLLSVSVGLSGLQEGLIIVDPATGLPQDPSLSTTLTLLGPRQQIDALTASDFTVMADLSKAGAGVDRLPLTVTGPRFVRVRSKQPDDVTLRLAPVLAMTVPITVTEQGQTPFSYSIGTMTTGAKETVVRGPEELVQQVVGVSGSVALQGQTSDIRTTVLLKALDRNGDIVEGLTLTPDRISVHVPITAQFGAQQVSVVPDLRNQPAPGYAVGSIDWTPKIVEVVTSGAITGTFATVPIDIAGATAPLTRTVPLVQLPNVITRPQNVQVTVHISIVPISVQSQVPLVVPVSPVGLVAGYTVRADPAAVQVTLAGPFDRLSKLKPDAVGATVDLAGLGPGSYSVPVRIQAPSGLTVVEPADPTVRVTIAALTPTSTPRPNPPLPTPSAPVP